MAHVRTPSAASENRSKLYAGQARGAECAGALRTWNSGEYDAYIQSVTYVPVPLPPPALLCQGKATHGRSPTSPEGEGTGGAGPEEEGQIKGDINVLGV